jgi:HlyD family secretion protein
VNALKKKSNALWILLALALAGGGTYLYGSGRWFGKHAEDDLKGAAVRRGPLRISVLQRGNLAAKDSISIESGVEGQTTVLYLIPEGTIVKPGDLLVDLDASDLLEKKRQQEIAVQNAEAAYVKAKAQYDIQESQNLSDVEAAERKLHFAELDLDKYEKGDRIQLMSDAQDKILLAQSKLAQATNTKDWSTKLLDKGFVTKSDMDKDELDWESSDVQLKQAKQAKELFDKYEDPRKKIELDANVVEAQRGFERTKLRAQAQIVDFEAGRNTSKARLELEEQRLTKWNEQIAKARILSPEAGMVVYTRAEGRFGMGEPIQKGSMVRERQEILTIPRTGGMIAEASIHESVLKQVTPGLPCTLSVDALPGLSFKGKVQFVALLPDKGSWWANPNQRLYKTEISIDETHSEMRPGMSCNIEILTDEIPDTLYVPLQSVVTQRGDTIAFVAGGESVEQRKVKVGRNNDRWVEIEDGLKEGEIVLLSPPAGFVPEGKAVDGSMPPTADSPGRDGAQNPAASPTPSKPPSPGGHGEGTTPSVTAPKSAALDAKPAATSAAKPDATSVSKPDVTSVAKPDATSVVKSDTTSVASSSAKSDASHAAKPGVAASTSAGGGLPAH